MNQLTQEEAIEAVCPYMSTLYETKCITEKCMAWCVTQTHEPTCRSTYQEGKELAKKKQKGFCMRLKR